MKPSHNSKTSPADNGPNKVADKSRLNRMKRQSLGMHRLVGSMRIENPDYLSVSSEMEIDDNILQFADFGHVLK